jgi:hypothetical protein
MKRSGIYWVSSDTTEDLPASHRSGRNTLGGPDINP